MNGLLESCIRQQNLPSSVVYAVVHALLAELLR
jgi:hypothetical protein